MIELPTLRERQEDIPFLSDLFLDQIRRINRIQINGFSEEARRLLSDYDWPGNIRELKNVLEASALMATTDQLAIQDLPAPLQEYAILNQDKVLDIPLPLNPIEVRERTYIEEVLARCKGNKARAAEELGLSRRGFHRRDSTT